ncbi:hypothetical protein KEM48_007945 [Puccinia striiformis f. sp. tritici PST-130]|nr:hypothetical protein KEM48_007945 [Puccinia striiformis f. sp. tritici PST-130]
MYTQPCNAGGLVASPWTGISIGTINTTKLCANFYPTRLMDMNDQTLMAIYWPHTKSLRQYYKRGKKGAKTLVKDQEKNTKRQSLRRKSVACQLYLQQGVHSRFVEVFDASSANLDNELILEDTTVIALAKITTCVPKRLLPSLAELKRKDKLNTFAKKKALRMAPPIFDMMTTSTSYFLNRRSISTHTLRKHTLIPLKLILEMKMTTKGMTRVNLAKTTQ